MLNGLFTFKKPDGPKVETLQVGDRSVPLVFVQHPRAKRYLLRLRPDGVARVTVPRRGTIGAATDFARRNINWLDQQLQRLATQPKTPSGWSVGTEILFRGEPVRIEALAEGVLGLGMERIAVGIGDVNLRAVVQKHLRQIATRELSPRVRFLADLHGVEITRVTVRDQKSRWGSCSRRGTISLNWRLIQTPEFVRDYIILHELAHRRQMNHSDKFWQEVERLCPDYRTAERWLKQNAKLLR